MNAATMRDAKRMWSRDAFSPKLGMPFLTALRALGDFFSGDVERFPRTPPPALPLNAAALAGTNAEVGAAWLGHSTVLLRIEGALVLTDPIFSDRAAPFPLVSPKRFNPKLPVTIEDLPSIDVALISHDHYDHLDEASVKRLASRVRRFVVPSGVEARLREWGVAPDKITALAWGECAEPAPGLVIRSLPARHFSGRGLTDRNKTLWTSYALTGKSVRVFFSGDTGYHPAFAEFGRLYGPFDLTLLECGAYSPYWPEVHMSPEQTARAHAELGGRVLLPIHWAAFNLSLHAWNEPIERLLAVGALLGLRIATPRPGEILVGGAPIPTAPWWRSGGADGPRSVAASSAKSAVSYVTC